MSPISLYALGILGLDIIRYLNASYAWSDAFVSTSSGLLGSHGILCNSLIKFTQLDIICNLGLPVTCVCLRYSCICTLPAILFLSALRNLCPRCCNISPIVGPV